MFQFKKKVLLVLTTLILAVSSVFAQTSVEYTSFTFEADVMMKAWDPNPTRLAWRNVLYAENVVVEGSSADFLLKSVNIKKGFTGFALYQEGGKSFAVGTNGKEQKFAPGKLFTKAGGQVWLSFTAPDKKKYALPTDIKILSQEEYEALSKPAEIVVAEKEVTEPVEELAVETEASEEEAVLVADQTEAEEEAPVEVAENLEEAAATVEVAEVTEDAAVEEATSEETISEESVETVAVEEGVTETPKVRGEFEFVRDSRNFPEGDTDEIIRFVGINKQAVEKETNVSTIIRNVPDGTKPKIFFMNGLEVLVYIAPDLSLRADDNCYTLFYSTRRYGREEDFSIPKRVIENPKINGKLTNMLDFDGAVTLVGGKQKLVLVWTQCTIQNTEETSEEDLLKKTAIYWSSWKENDKSWEKAECISEMKGSLQFDPRLIPGAKGLALKIRNRPDNTLYSVEDNPAFAEKQHYFLMNKKGLWETCGAGDFEDPSVLYDITDKNNVIAADCNYAYNRTGGLAGCLWSSGSDIFAKVYMKSPDTKKMIWTESVPVLHQKKGSEVQALNPHAMVRDTGDWIVAYVLKTEKGNNICISKINNEPCIVSRKLVPDLRDLQKPGNSVHFTVTMENLGIGIASGMDVVIKNEFKTEAGVVSYKNNFYPGESYELNGIYQKLKGKDGIVPVEDVFADVKFGKMMRNSEFAFYDAIYTLGIPKFVFGDMFVMTKGKSQKVIYTLGTSNGVKVKAPACEVVVTESAPGDYEDNVVSVSVDNNFSDDYLEMAFDYETAELDEKYFVFDALFHFEESKRKIPGWNPEDVEKETAVSYSCKVYNPIYTKKSFSAQLMDLNFIKKTKVMSANFIVANNWPEMIADSMKLSLINVATGQTEQIVEVDFELDILESKKGTVYFAPGLSDKAEDYIVQIMK
ncbi:MAG: hypothetical protein MJ181_05455 [Treponema sp.]|nr:hypothetical protein [Treponema sp.]